MVFPLIGLYELNVLQGYICTLVGINIFSLLVTQVVNSKLQRYLKKMVSGNIFLFDSIRFYISIW